jgi:hypothetical protein
VFRYLIGQGCRRLINAYSFDPLSIRFHSPFHHHDTTPIATSPMLILRAMLDTSAHQQYFATAIFTTGHQSTINNIASYFLENFYMHSQVSLSSPLCI